MSIVTDWKVIVGVTKKDAKTLGIEDYKSVYDFMEDNLPSEHKLSTLNHGYGMPDEVFGVSVLGGNYHHYINLEDLNVYTEDLIRTLNHHFCTNLFAVYIGTKTH